MTMTPAEMKEFGVTLYHQLKTNYLTAMESQRHQLQMELLIDALLAWLEAREDGYARGNIVRLLQYGTVVSGNSVIDRVMHPSIPLCVFGNERLFDKLIQFVELRGKHYVELSQPFWMEDAGLGLTLWGGEFEGVPSQWLRWRYRTSVAKPLAKRSPWR